MQLLALLDATSRLLSLMAETGQLKSANHFSRAAECRDSGPSAPGASQRHPSTVQAQKLVAHAGCDRGHLLGRPVVPQQGRAPLRALKNEGQSRQRARRIVDLPSNLSRKAWP